MTIHELIETCTQDNDGWDGNVYESYNDGDMVDTLNIATLENIHNCDAEEPYLTMRWSSKSKTRSGKFVMISARKGSSKILDHRQLSVCIFDGPVKKEELQIHSDDQAFMINVSNGAIFDLTDNSNIQNRRIRVQWEDVADAIRKHRPYLAVNEYRKEDQPIWLQTQ